MKTLFVYCLVFALLVPVQGLAHKDRRFLPGCPSCGQDKPQISIEEIPTRDAGLTDSDLRAIADSVHHTLEEEDEKASWYRKVLNNFNFKQVAIRAIRFNGINQTRPDLAGPTANVILMLLASHALETYGGLSLTSSMVASDLNPFVRVILGGAGVLITVPGLDPLCIILLGAYNAAPVTANRILEVPRTVLLKTTEFGNRVAGIPAGYWSDLVFELNHKLVEFKLGTRLKMSGLTLAETESGFGVNVMSAYGYRIAHLDFSEVDSKRVGLTTVTMKSHLNDEERSKLKSVASVFGMNIKSWVTQLSNANLGEEREKLRELAWVQEINETENGFEVKTNPNAFRMPNTCLAFAGGSVKPAVR